VEHFEGLVLLLRGWKRRKEETRTLHKNREGLRHPFQGGGFLLLNPITSEDDGTVAGKGPKR
jgi:hypothetical protein